MVDEYPNDITDCELFMTTSAACNNYSMQKVLYTRKIHVLNMYWSCNRFFFWPVSAISALLSFRHSLTRFSSTPNFLAALRLLSPSAHATTFNLTVKYL